ncbi:hypothetical protein BSKO_11953 [Bryopsis sp. KO-2023]|nr:hypothetical protein BSKO_11953 [Bryopsis sp. KO-2023]
MDVFCTCHSKHGHVILAKLPPVRVQGERKCTGFLTQAPVKPTLAACQSRSARSGVIAMGFRSEKSSRELSVGVDPTPTTNPTESAGSGSLAFFMGAALAVQSIALVGAIVGGVLARGRRVQLEKMNVKLREVNSELRKRRDQDTHVCEADAEAEAMKSYKAALEMAMDAPAAAHPIEGYGREGYSLAQARREFSLSLQDGKGALLRNNGMEAMAFTKRALELAQDIKDRRAQRSVFKVQAQAYKLLGESQKALQCLNKSLQISKELDEQYGNVDVYGEMADIHADMGDFETAAEYYDKCIEAIQTDEAEPISPYWDC